MIKKIIIMMMLLVSFAYAAEFYSGSTFISSLDTTIGITNEKAFVVSNYVFKGDDKVKVNFVGLPDAVVEFDGKTYSREFSINPDGEKTVKASYEFDFADEDVQGFKYSPKPTFDDKLYSGKVTHNLKVTAPSYIKEFTSMTRDYSSTSQENGNNIFTWDEYAYLKPLVLKWNTLDLDISVIREIPDTIEGIFEVRVTVTNNDDVDVENLLLEDNFMTSHFEGVSPEEEFKIESDEFDARLFWRKTVSLKAGESKTVSYNLNALELSKQSIFNPLYVKYGNVIVASTEKQVYYTDEVKAEPIAPKEEFSVTPSLQELGPEEIPTPEKPIPEEKIPPEPGAEKGGIAGAMEEAKQKVSEAVEKTKNNIGLVILVLIIIVFIFIFFKKKGKATGGHLETYIRTHLKKGFSRQQIKNTLLRAKWPKQKIEEAFRKIR